MFLVLILSANLDANSINTLFIIQKFGLKDISELC
jgi:hypothetical protein